MFNYSALFTGNANNLEAVRASIGAIFTVPVAKLLFEKIYREGVGYRATAVTIGGISSDENVQPDLFEDNVRAEKVTRVSRTVDAINDRFGRHTVSFASSLFLGKKSAGARAGRNRLNLPQIFAKI